jgi:hypothetical protein
MSILDGPGPVTQPQAAPQVAPATTNDPLNPTATSPQQGGFLNDLGVDWAGLDVSNEPAPGTYRCFLVKSEIRTKKDGTKSWVFSYRVNEGQPEEGKIKEDWRPLPQTANGHFASDKDATFARFLKQRLMELGVPEDRVGSVSPEQLKGTECFVTIVLNNGYKNVTKVVLASEVDGSGLTQQPQGGVQGLI